jgi:hypothetical protein
MKKKLDPRAEEASEVQYESSSPEQIYSFPEYGVSVSAVNIVQAREKLAKLLKDKGVENGK